MLTHFWTLHLPIIQSSSPASLAAEIVLSTIDSIESQQAHFSHQQQISPKPRERRRIAIIDLCSGGGGPIPAIARAVNASRKKHDAEPIDFILSDLHPHVEAWKVHSAEDPHVGYVPVSLDATSPAEEKIKGALKALRKRRRELEEEDDDDDYDEETMVLRMFCLAFHHFDDPLAKKILVDAMTNADGLMYVYILFHSLLLIPPFLSWYPYGLPYTYVTPFPACWPKL